jgi:hypothetical protein
VLAHAAVAHRLLPAELAALAEARRHQRTAITARNRHR